MSTSQSPLRVLKAQADRIAAMLKAAERGEKLPNDPALVWDGTDERVGT